MNKASSWKPIIEKFYKRPTSWKARTLSYGGRLTLIKSVLGALGTYYFSLFKAPECVINYLEKLRRTFFWGGYIDRNKMAWVSWKKICFVSNCEVLGIGSLQAKNLAMLSKWWWRFHNENNALWKQIITSVHGINGGIFVDSLPNYRLLHSSWVSITKTNSSLSTTGVNLHSLFTRGIDIQLKRCPVCDEDLETTQHLFVDCSLAKSLWKKISSWFSPSAKIQAIIPGPVEGGGPEGTNDREETPPPLTKGHIEGHVSALKSLVKSQNRKNKGDPIRLDFKLEDTELYDDTTNPEDHLSRFASAANSGEWLMPVWCWMFQQTLDVSARGWACFKEPYEITKIIRRFNESFTAFKERWKVETGFIMGVPEVMKILLFMDSVKSPELAKRFSDKVPTTVNEMMELLDDFV
nr:reverse transcriptase domain, reverse transcriptase zinc-binding domain protein [Tanacetum cinerariifolium]